MKTYAMADESVTDLGASAQPFAASVSDISLHKSKSKFASHQVFTISPHTAAQTKHPRIRRAFNK